MQTETRRLAQLDRLTIAQAAKLADVDARTIKQLIADSKIEATQTNTGIVFVETKSLLVHLSVL